jgi:hypothetical protein
MKSSADVARFVVLVAVLLLVPALGAPSSSATADPLVEALAAAGISADSLTFEPRGTWLRYPDPRQIPYVNRTFDDLFREPSRIDDTLRLMARAAGDFLAPSYRSVKDDGLFRTVYYTGWELRLAGHRDYTAGLDESPTAAPSGEDPLVYAVSRLYTDVGRPFDLFGMDKPADWPRRREDTRAAAAKLDPDLRRILAQAVLDLADALRWHRIAFARVDGKDMIAAFALRDLGATQFDGMEYFPEADRIAKTYDEWALNTSSRKVVAAGERLVKALEAWRGKTKADLASQAFDGITPAGRIVVSGAGDDQHEEPDVLLLVDLGGNDVYRGATGATGSLLQPVSLAVDLAGNDRYEALDDRTPAQGSGILGTGVLLDVAGNDVYRAKGSSQGYGLFGTGILADLAGNDRYELGVEGQGAAEFGVGVLADLAGDDEYRLISGGQGFGGVGNGIGTLVDLAGNDRYFAEPDSAKAYRPDSHSQLKVNYSYAQGAAAGRRGDLMDGHSWAGGVGTLIDLAGDDQYLSGNWSLGSGYWYGIGWVYDATGNDRYSASVFSLASGAHFCIGALVDEEGNDRYEGYGDSHTGLAFGHDFTIALLYDGAGNDAYRFGADGFGFAINMSLAFFVDAGGDDVYVMDKGKEGFGATNFKPEDLAPPVTRSYVADPVQVGLFLDAGGKDAYLEHDPGGGRDNPRPSFKDGAVRVRPASPARESQGKHAGIFFDRAGAKPAEVEWFRQRWSPLPPPQP